MLSTLKPKRFTRGGGGGVGGSKIVRIEKKNIEDKYSIKNLIFLPSRATYVIPFDTQGHKLFSCVDCGDKFVCESSYNYHVNRRSVKITYTCRHCCRTMVYMNRCNVLSHIRSHVLRTATINLCDMKVEPLPIEDMVFGMFHIGEGLTWKQVQQNEELRKLQRCEDVHENDEDCSITTDPVVEIDITEEIDVDKNDEIVIKVEPPSSPPPIRFQRIRRVRKVKCVHCEAYYGIEGSLAASRAKHYSFDSTREYCCFMCPYKASNSCALKAHVRFHKTGGMNCLCPECGAHIKTNHDCPGYKLFRDSAVVLCPCPKCGMIKVSNFTKHITDEHIRAVYKCSLCHTACLTESSVQNHLIQKHANMSDEVIEIMLYYQCSLCPGRLVLKQMLTSHINSHKHTRDLIFPCKYCDFVGVSVEDIRLHSTKCSVNPITASTYQITKTCPICLHETVYEFDHSNFPAVPNVCPNKCGNTTMLTKTNVINPDYSNANEINNIKCPLCKEKVDSGWSNIKAHFSQFHEEHKCVDIKFKLRRIDTDFTSVTDKDSAKNKSQTNKRKRGISVDIPVHAKRRRNREIIKHNNNGNAVNREPKKEASEYTCRKCGDSSANDLESFRAHIKIHKDPTMAYQCMDCGSCFVVKPSFSTHLFVAHGITDAEKYIEENDCFNEEAFKDDPKPEEPLEENQCRICREEFSNADELNKHFRVHGMAFLMEKRQKK